MTTPDVRAGMLSLNHKGRAYELRFPEGPAMRAELQKLFAGGDYPILKLPGYQPAVIVDIGANIGAAALYLHMFYPSARVLCFEPSTTNFRFLKQNLSFTDRFELFPFGLHDRNAELPLFQGRDQPMQNSFVSGYETTADFENAAIRRASEEFSRIGLDAISILKLDTEGCELPILRDIRPWIEKIELMYIEFHSEQDRRSIDHLLEDRFTLAWARVPIPHRGTCLYVSHELVRRYPVLDDAKIAPQNL